MTMISSKLLKKINDHPITKDEMRVYLASLECTDAPPSFSHSLEVSMSIFNDNTAKCFSLSRRLEALNNILSSGKLHGWINASNEEDCAYIPESIFIAAGVTPLVLDGAKISFAQDDLLQMAFKVGGRAEEA